MNNEVSNEEVVRILKEVAGDHTIVEEPKTEVFQIPAELLAQVRYLDVARQQIRTWTTFSVCSYGVWLHNENMQTDVLIPWHAVVEVLWSKHAPLPTRPADR